MGQGILQALAREFDLGNDRLGISAPASASSPIPTVRRVRQHPDALRRPGPAPRQIVRTQLSSLCSAAILSDDIQRRVLLEARLKHALERNELAAALPTQTGNPVGSPDGMGSACCAGNRPSWARSAPMNSLRLPNRADSSWPIGEWVLARSLPPVAHMAGSWDWPPAPWQSTCRRGSSVKGRSGTRRVRNALRVTGSGAG
jgi:diguanylate cyclase